MSTMKMTRGDTKQVRVTVNNLPATGLSGYSFWFTVKNDFKDADDAAVIRKVPTDFSVIQQGSDVQAGIAVCKIDPTETANLPDYTVNMVWDVQIKSSSGDVFTPLSGRFKVSPDATRSTT